MHWIAGLIAGGLACLCLWFPSAVIGIGVEELAGQKPYLRFGALAAPALIGLALLAVPVAILALVSTRDALRRAGRLAASVVLVWQIGWAAIALVSRSQSLIMWPFYALPSEPIQWEGWVALALGLSIVAGLMALVLIALRPRRKLQPAWE